MVLESETPGLEGTYHITRDERERFSSSEGIYDVDETNPSGLPPADVAPSKRKRLRFSTTIHNISTWNVCGMNIGKQEMQRLHIDLQSAKLYTLLTLLAIELYPYASLEAPAQSRFYKHMH
ncbi:hypothetical protein HELRODRAFT_176182 [Helobdella robusta]|uniref:Uncharacterized protein n=1 Tax=Helobdella robusta TaxID=6412 RepID=T1FA96_HELRO|nr:hypothetical protein HELRODRAFT_176182 [Helobdella robusta]ESO00313.1 hypothetical protein HELRODRAFT_176182 [Helobdella robusta]